MTEQNKIEELRRQIRSANEEILALASDNGNLKAKVCELKERLSAYQKTESTERSVQTLDEEWLRFRVREEQFESVSLKKAEMARAQQKLQATKDGIELKFEATQTARKSRKDNIEHILTLKRNLNAYAALTKQRQRTRAENQRLRHKLEAKQTQKTKQLSAMLRSADLRSKAHRRNRFAGKRCSQL